MDTSVQTKESTLLVWDVVTDKIPTLRRGVQQIIEIEEEHPTR